MSIRFAVLDDEHIIATDLAYQVAQRPGWTLAGVFNDPAALRRNALELNLDICFLDVETPSVDGLTLARELKSADPDLLIVFVTAYHQYASAAFRIAAVDYLVKPVTPESLEEACGRVEARRGVNAPGAPDKFAVLSAGRIDYVNIADVIAAKAAGNYVALLTEEREHLHRVTLTDLAATLVPLGFLRTHRSYLVRPTCIVSAKTRGETIVEVILSRGLLVPVSETYRGDVADALAAFSLQRR